MEYIAEITLLKIEIATILGQSESKSSEKFNDEPHIVAINRTTKHRFAFYL